MASWRKRDIIDIAVEIVPDLEERQGDEGLYYIGCCPFHDDHHPSFTIYPNDGPDNARWVCWSGCGSGDVIDLVQRHFDLSFKDALKIATDEADEADIALEIARRTLVSSEYDFLLLSMRMNRLFHTLDFERANGVCYEIDAAIEAGDFAEIEIILRRYDV